MYITAKMTLAVNKANEDRQDGCPEWTKSHEQSAHTVKLLIMWMSGGKKCGFFHCCCCWKHNGNRTCYIKSFTYDELHYQVDILKAQNPDNGKRPSRKQAAVEREKNSVRVKTWCEWRRKKPLKSDNAKRSPTRVNGAFRLWADHRFAPGGWGMDSGFFTWRSICVCFMDV